MPKKNDAGSKAEHHYFRVVIAYSDGETSGNRVFKDRAKAEKWAARQEKSGVVKKAVVQGFVRQQYKRGRYSMTYKCPYCEKIFSVTELQMPAGPSAGAYCLRCGDRVLVFYPYLRLVTIFSLLIAIGTLTLLHVSSFVMFAIGIIVIWIPLSVYLKFVSARYGAAYSQTMEGASKDLLRVVV